MTADLKDALRKAATVIQTLERKVTAAQAAEARRAEPIAIIGTGCRLPGGVRDLAGFGAALRAGLDAVRPVPRDRFDIDAVFDADPDAAGKIYVREAAWLDAVDQFDPEFFGIAPREAAWLDPQHRLVLECAWEALDDAGVAADRLRNANVGVYLGIGPSDYAARITDNPPDAIEAGTGTGTGVCFSAGRVSFLLGLHGPSLAVDTACSSSLVALHLACQALRNGDCELALAGGVQVMLSAETFLVLSRLRALAPDGRCKPFSDRANGYGRGEGCGMIVLKRLADAQRDGDRVLALIKGSAINHDGPSSGLTTPNGAAQRDVVRRALASAGVAPADVDYVEAHGTGTALGDPIEIEALAEVYGAGRARPLAVGAVKSNVGHLEWAAGIAGLLKVVAALRDGALPPSLHAAQLNPAVDWASLPVRIVRAVEAWPAGERARRAGVSSFGMSGTNAHIIIEEAPATPPAAVSPARAVELITLSARTADGLTEVAQRLRAQLVAQPQLALSDLAFNLATTRAHHPQRRAIVAASHAELVAALDGDLGVRGQVRARRGKLAFVFTGQGAQVAGMGRALAAAWPAFRAAWDDCAARFDRLLPRPLAEVAWAADGAALDQTLYTQPALFAFEYALCALWRALGVDPDLLIGHSIGELVAACVAGVFSLDDAARLVAARARLMQALPAGGAMLAVEASEADAQAAIAPHTATVALAAVNGPASVVISGDERAVLAIGDGFAARGVRTKRLRVSHAFHSPRMAPMLAELEAVARTVTYRAPDRPIVSNLTGAIAGPELATAAYWVRHVAQAVRFADGVRALAAAGATTFIELGPRPALLPLVAASASGEPVLIASQSAGRDEAAGLLAALASWYVHGGGLDWRAVFPAGGQRLALPSYPWQRARHWIERTPRGGAGAGSAGRGDEADLVLRADDAAGDGLDAFLAIDWPSEPVAPARLATGRWCVIGGGALGEALISALIAAGHHAQAADDPTATAIVHLGSLDAPDLAGVAGLDAALVAGYDSVLATVQAIAARSGASPRLWLVTRGAQPVAGAPVAIAHAPLIGFGRVIASEHRELRCARLDLDPARPAGELAAVLAELLADGADDEVALRGGARHVARVTSRAPQPPAYQLARGAAGELVLRVAERRPPAAGELALAVEASVLDAGALAARPGSGSAELASDCAGRVVALGAGVTGFAIGQPVAVLAWPGALGSHVTLPATRAWPVPASQSLVDAAALPSALRAGALSPPTIWTLPISQAGSAAAAGASGPIVLTQPDPAAEATVAAQAAAIRRDGSYLITGGLGGLGLGVAGWLAARGAGHLVLVGRSPAGPAHAAALAALEAHGARVTVVAADIAQRAGVDRAIAAAEAVAPLRGIVHAAGTLDVALIVHQTPARLRSVIAAKLHGALHLHEATLHAGLDWFVLYSSVAGLIGSPGQANYAAANAGLDALAHHRRARGLPALSIDWGAFADVGMAARADDHAAARLMAQGLRSMTPADGLRVLERLLASSAIQAGVVLFDGARWVAGHPGIAQSRMWSAVTARYAGAAAEAPAAEAETGFAAELAAASPEARGPLVLAAVRRQVAHILQLAEATLDPDLELLRFGMDSLTGLELRNQLDAQLGLQLPATLIFQYPTIRAVAELATSALMRAAIAFDDDGATAASDDDEEGTL